MKPLGRVSTKPIDFSSLIWRARRWRGAAMSVEAARVDAFAQAQAHHQHLVALFLPGEDIVGHHAVAARLHALVPVERHLLGGGGVALVVDQQPPMRAGADADIFAIAPVDQVVPVSRPGRAWVGDTS